MLGNNSGGSHSIAYGLTVEHVIEITTLLADGSRVVFGEVTPDAVRGQDARARASRARSTARSARIRDEYEARDPRALSEALAPRLRLQPQRARASDGPLNMARLIVGSEGTLLTMLEAKMRLVRRPKKTALDVIHYHDIQEALESSQSILETGPYAVELTDKMILDLARDNIEQATRMGFVQGDPAAILIVEYAGDTEAEVRAKVEALEARRAARALRLRRAHRLRRRRAAVDLEAAQGRARPPARHARATRSRIAFVEDTAVDPKHLPELRAALPRDHGQARRRRRLLRPLLGGLPAHPPRHQPQDRRAGSSRCEAIADEIIDLVLEFGGTISSEHGDGRARSPFLERMFGADADAGLPRAQARLRSRRTG